MRALITALGLLALHGTAVAQDADSPHAADAQARELFSRGQEAYGDGRFEEALVRFRVAHELSGRAELLYNVGLAAMNLGRDAEALAAFEGYLEATPDAANRGLVEARIDSLRRRLEEEQDRRRRLAAAEAEAQEPPSPVPGWALTITGAVVAIAGGILLAVGLGDVSTVEDATPGTAWSDLSSANDRAPVLTGVGITAIGVGAALSAVGLVLLVAAGGAEPGVALNHDGLRGRF